MNSSLDFHQLPGPTLLLAGPGTGKTHQLAKRIKYLIEESEIPPDNITVITFTSAAARNMHERISDPEKKELYIQPAQQPTRICTMHSLGYSIVREKATELGFTDEIRVVYSDTLRNILIQDAAQLSGYSRKEGNTAAKYRQFGKLDNIPPQVHEICQQYEAILRRCSAIDYDDQILLACSILKEDTALLNKYRQYCQHLLIDEYQDINAGQFELISLLTEGQSDGLFAVGDDDQSIYSWRGGSPEFIRNFTGYFDESAKVEPLTVSYRCLPDILEGALEVVAEHDTGRLPKGEFSYKRAEIEKIKVHNVASERKEAKIIRSIVERASPTRSVLILIPHRGYSRTIVDELSRAGISCSAPITPPGEGLPLLSILSKWLKAPNGNFHFRECLEAFINSPESGIPSKLSRKTEKIEQREEAYRKFSCLWRHMFNHGATSLWQALEKEKDSHELILHASTVFMELREVYQGKGNPSDFLGSVQSGLTPWSSIESLLSEAETWVESIQQVSGITRKHNVQLMTFQGAKGLEANLVCIIGLEDGTIPRTGSSKEDLAEQSRLLFVSMTRAIDELHLFHARKRPGAVLFRQVYTKGQKPDIHPSSFINSISSNHKEEIYHQA